MDLKFLDTLFFISLGAILIPIILLTISIHRQPIEFKWLAVVLLFSFLCDVASEILFRFKLPVNYAGNAYGSLSPVFFAFFFYSAIKSKSLRLPLLILVTSYLIFSGINLLLIQKIDINTYSDIIRLLFIMSLSIFYFYKLIQELPTTNIETFGLFWVVSGFFLTNSAKLVLFSFAAYMVKIFNDNLIVLWVFHNVLSIIGNLIIGWGVWLQFKEATKKAGNVSNIHFANSTSPL